MEDGADVSRRQVLIGGGLAASAPLLAGAARPATGPQRPTVRRLFWARPPAPPGTSAVWERGVGPSPGFQVVKQAMAGRAG